MSRNKADDTSSEKDAKQITAKPFIKWAGGKGKLLLKLEEMLPVNFDDLQDVTYIEPFVGGGAMLFHMLQKHKCIRKVVINDINPDLIRCYQLIAKEPYILIERLKLIEQNYYNEDILDKKELYYAYRQQFNKKGIHLDERAAIFIFLNHTCFNGLFRVNTSGAFNVPYGRYKHPVICNEELILADHKLLSSVELVIREPGDYKNIIRNLSRKYANFIYFDPPYRPVSETSYFKEYSTAPFGDTQQEELKLFCDHLSGLGCKIMVSNSDSRTKNGESFFENLYQGYNIEYILAPRFINANPDKRQEQGEIVIRNYKN